MNVQAIRSLCFAALAGVVISANAGTVSFVGTALTNNGTSSSCNYSQLSEDGAGNWTITCGSGPNVITVQPVVIGGSCLSYASMGENVAGGWNIVNCVSVPVATIYYIHTDHLGTPRFISRASDNGVAWRWDNQEPFGANAPNENPAGLGQFVYNLRFPGQYFDTETATHYNYFRDYDPSIGRYMESDPIGLKGGLSTYAYVFNNPLGASDPMGLIVQQCCRKTKLTLNTIPHCWLKTDTKEAGMNEAPQCTIAGGQIGSSVPGGSGYPGMPVYVSEHSCDKADTCEIAVEVDEDCVNKELEVGKRIGRFLPWNNCQTYVSEVLKKCSKTPLRDPYIGYPHLFPAGQGRR